MFHAYCDESGHERRDEHVFLAGFLGHTKQWNLVRKKWEEAGGGQGFHTTSVLRNPKRAEARLARLASVPVFCGLRPIIGGVRMSDYWDLVKGTQYEKRAKGWCTALYPLVLETLLYIPKNERVEFIFEEQNEYRPFADCVMKAISQYPDERLCNADGLTKLAKWNFVPKKRAILNQPADYLAFAMMSFFRDPQGDAARLTKPILECIGNFPVVGEIFSRQKIRMILAAMPALRELRM